MTLGLEINSSKPKSDYNIVISYVSTSFSTTDRIEETFPVQIEHRERTVRSVLLHRLNFQVCQLRRMNGFFGEGEGDALSIFE